MKLVWHIASKDLRRMALPVGLWIAFIVGTAIWFRVASPAQAGDTAPGTVAWLAMMMIWVRFLAAGQWVIGYLLVGALVVEEPLVGSDHFWMTRPIANVRLLGAKFLAAALLFVAAPLLGLALFRLATGFRPGEIWVASIELGRMQVLLTLAALAIASLARNLVQFVFWTVAVLIGLYAFSYIVAVTTDYNPLSVTSVARVKLVTWALFIALAVAVPVHQFATRRAQRSWLVLVLGLMACLLIRAAWPWQTPPPTFAELKPLNERPENRVVDVQVEKASLSTRMGGGSRIGRLRLSPIQANLWLKLSPATAQTGDYFEPASALVAVRWPGGPAAEVLLGYSSGLVAAAEAMVRQSPAPATLSWTVYGMSYQSGDWPVSDAQIDGTVEVWRMRPRILGEFPARLDAGFASGASRSKVIAVESPPGWEASLVVEERGIRIVGTPGAGNVENLLTATEGHRDVFMLMNHQANRFAPLIFDELGATALNGDVVGFRRLFLRAPPPGEEWRQDAVIVEIRFERQGVLRRAIETGVSVHNEESLPHRR